MLVWQATNCQQFTKEKIGERKNVLKAKMKTANKKGKFKETKHSKNVKNAKRGNHEN